MAKKAKKKATKKKVGRKSSRNRLLYTNLVSTELPDDFDKFNYDQVQVFQKALNNSRILWDLERLMDTITSPHYTLNKWEKQAFEKVMEEYNLRYNNKLTKAME